jgi:hypothetical protein
MQLIHVNKNYEYRFYSNRSRLEFITKAFGQDSIQARAYSRIINGTWKADFFRMCVLYESGGVYLDCKAAAITPLDDFIKSDADFATFIDVIPYRVATGFLASTAKNTIIAAFMEGCINKVMNNDYGENQLDAGGPQTCGDILHSLFNLSPRVSLHPGRYQIPPIAAVHPAVTCGSYTYLYTNKQQVVADFIGKRRLFGEYLCDANDVPVIKREPAAYLFSPYRLMRRYELGWVFKSCFSS